MNKRSTSSIECQFVTLTISSLGAAVIPIHHGHYFALVDIADAPLVLPINWEYKKERGGYIGGWHIGKNKTIKMHRLILKTKLACVDHINRNKKDNRRCNLRAATKSQNCANAVKPIRQVKSSSKYKGVSWRSDALKWRSYITLNYQRIYLGNFDKEIEAAIAYNEAAKKYFGEFALFNKV